MENNAIINSKFFDLLDILEAREWVDVFIQDKEGNTRTLDRCRVYQLYKNEKYRNYEVIGLYIGIITTNILIKEA